jgi:DNA repair protein SbcC/Rad50
MIPLRLELTGFMTYRDTQVFDFCSAPLWMLEGGNGSGKSTVFDAITFALFSTYRGGKKQHIEVLINHRSANFEIVFDFAFKGQDYRIRRFAKWVTNNKQQRTDKTSQTEGLYLLPSEALITNNVVDWVKEQIGLDYDSFTSSVLLLQGSSEKLILAKGKERADILLKFLDLKVYENLVVKARDAANSHRRKVSERELTLQTLKHATETGVETAKRQVEQTRQDFDSTCSPD